MSEDNDEVGLLAGTENEELVAIAQEEPERLDEHDIQRLGGLANDLYHKLNIESHFEQDYATQHVMDLNQIEQSKQEALHELATSMAGYLDFLAVHGNEKFLVRAWVERPEEEENAG